MTNTPRHFQLHRDTALAIADAILAWIAVAAAVLTVVLLTAVVTGAWAWRAVRERASGPAGADS